MRIGVDATCWANGRGYGRFARELLRAMVLEGTSHEFVCFVDDRTARCFDLTGPRVHMVVVPQSASPRRPRVPQAVARLATCGG
jgi:hypothetical protein